MEQDSAFNLLHEGVRRQLWAMKWNELRPLQVDAIRHILASDGHAILSAGTAAGKTEAAFLPVLSAIADEGDGSIRAMYIGPLKALINDQFGRLEELCEHLALPVHRWHGDVPAAAKKRLVDQPGGVLLITPESLESLFVNRSNALLKLFGGLRFVVIDELHSFLDNERGLHLRNLLYRVERLTVRPPRFIGLSATIGEPRVAVEYIDQDQPQRVQYIVGDGAESEVRLMIHAYEGDAVSDNDTSNAGDDGNDGESEPVTSQDHKLAMDLVKHCKGHTNLVFANRRNDVELFGDLCNTMAAAQGLPDLFLVHHGSLSAEIRRDAEVTMKQASRSSHGLTTLCTSSLEMGIDIGSVRMVGQIDPPHSVSSLKQRIGRSGRRGDPRTLRMYIRSQKVDERSSLFDRLHLPLIQSIAVTELLLKKWIEPPEPSSFDLSTLSQQVMSIIAQTGGCQASVLFDALCKRGAFREVDATIFSHVLRQLGAEDIIEQTSQGDLILGLVGERLRKDKGFYAVFPTVDAFAVLHNGQKIGAVDDAPQLNEHMILAGRRWRVVDVDVRQHTILVQPATGFKRAPFAPTDRTLHAEIAKMMRIVLDSSERYAYLDATATRLLSDARESAATAGVCRERFVALGPKQTAVMAWIGSRTFRTLLAVFRAAGLTPKIEQFAFIFEDQVDVIRQKLDGISVSPPTVEQLVNATPASSASKYSAHLQIPVLSEAVTRRLLDIGGASRWFQS